MRHVDEKTLAAIEQISIHASQCGMRPPYLGETLFPSQFQSTHPNAGCDWCRVFSKFYSYNFNPRIPMRDATTSLLKCPVSSAISIHASQCGMRPQHKVVRSDTYTKYRKTFPCSSLPFTIFSSFTTCFTISRCERPGDSMFTCLSHLSDSLTTHLLYTPFYHEFLQNGAPFEYSPNPGHAPALFPSKYKQLPYYASRTSKFQRSYALP